MIRAKIDVTKIDKAHIFVGAKGKYIDISLIEKPNEYGDDGFVTQNLPKNEDGSYPRGPILGNWKKLEPKKNGTPKPSRPPHEDDSDIPW